MQSLSAVFTAYTFLHDETQAQTSPNPFARDHACVIASNHNPVNRLTFMKNVLLMCPYIFYIVSNT